MAKLTDSQYDIIFTEAFAAAKTACNTYLTKHPDAWYPCGFAWVILDGRSPAVNFLKKNRTRLGRLAGDKGYPKGWHIWDPSNSGTQCMDAKMLGAEAFASTLRRHGINCEADCRMD